MKKREKIHPIRFADSGNIIEFKGELSENVKKFLTKIYTKIAFKAFLFSFLMTSVFLGPLGVILLFSRIPELSILGFVAPFTSFVLLLIPLDRGAYMPKRVFIDLDDRVVVAECAQGDRYRLVDDVEEVYDYGEWYYLYINTKSNSFVFQKNLITKGAIEEFEALFEGKIVRKTESAS